MKIKSGVIIALITCIFTGCTLKSNDTDIEYFRDSDAIALSEEVMGYVLDDNVEEVINLFSPFIQSSHNLNEEILLAIEFIDGEIISYDDPEGYISGKTYEDHEVTSLNVSGSITNICTDTNKTYQINFEYYQVYESNSDCVGMCYINVCDMDEFIWENNYPEDAKITIGEGY